MRACVRECVCVRLRVHVLVCARMSACACGYVSVCVLVCPKTTSNYIRVFALQNVATSAGRCTNFAVEKRTMHMKSGCARCPERSKRCTINAGFPSPDLAKAAARLFQGQQEGIPDSHHNGSATRSPLRRHRASIAAPHQALPPFDASVGFRFR